ncbi:MAG: enoyl-CoA hydratase/isomerase family protein, partial [Polaromonas sp.]|nr:enoyl-CoA hydratase/isomerase family protein [Polaromonas sp.]
MGEGSRPATRYFASMTGAVTLNVSGSLARVTLSNRRKLNAMSLVMWAELREVFAHLQDNSSLSAVVVQGKGGHFCAGGEILEYPLFRFTEASPRELHELEVWGGLQASLDRDLPIAARIEGNCMGAGLEIVSCCDIRISATSAHFGVPMPKLGFPMAPREAALVMRAAGELTARKMLLSAAVLDAPVMQQRGFLNEVVASDELDETVRVCTDRMAELSREAARLNKQFFKQLIAETQQYQGVVAM